jgi:hypothetical protein
MIIRTLPVLGVKTDRFFNIAFKVCLVYLFYNNINWSREDY